jgi:hypothetical protein
MLIRVLPAGVRTCKRACKPAIQDKRQLQAGREPGGAAAEL